MEVAVEIERAIQTAALLLNASMNIFEYTQMQLYTVDYTVE